MVPYACHAFFNEDFCSFLRAVNPVDYDDGWLPVACCWSHLRTALSALCLPDSMIKVSMHKTVLCSRVSGQDVTTGVPAGVPPKCLLLPSGAENLFWRVRQQNSS